MTYRMFLIAVLAGLMSASTAWAQSSSIYKRTDKQRMPQPMRGDRLTHLFAGVAESSFIAVRLPPPRRFMINDLITIIVRESVHADSNTMLDTEKSVEQNGEIGSFPNLRLRDLLDFQLSPSGMKHGKPKLGIEFKNEFKGEGQRRRTDSFIARITARIVDVKPNGTFVIEGRKYIKTDKESTRLLITGTCRPEDVSASNTILSTQLHDLHLTNEHDGELSKAVKKGWVTKLFDTIFNF